MEDTVQTFKLGWAINHYGGIGPAIKAAETKAIELIRIDQESSLEWAQMYIPYAGKCLHAGDCSKARVWLQAPITCDACVYDEFMLEAWKALRLEITGV